MPVTINTSVMKYKDNEGDYIDVNGVGLEFIDDTATEDTERGWSAKKITEELAKKPDLTARGKANGYASLDSAGLVPRSQLPAYVDDVLEYASTVDFPETGESGKIYVDASTNSCYRWSGTQYIYISSGLALGETAQSAYRGDRGKAAYDHATAKGSAFSGFNKLTTNNQGHVTGSSAVTKYDLTALGIPDIKIVEEYTRKQYRYDDYCYYKPTASSDGKLYRCIRNITEPEDFDSTHWEEVTVTGELTKIRDRLYQEIAIDKLSFYAPASGLVLRGTTINASDIQVDYELNKESQVLKLNNAAVANPATSGRISPSTGSWTMDSASKAMTLYAEDERSATATRSINLNFQNYVYWGVATIPGAVDSAFVTSLPATVGANPVLTSTRARTIEVDDGTTAGYHIWYAVPKRLGLCKFVVGGFDGGFEHYDEVSVTNSAGYSEDYYVYRSDNDKLGVTTVVIS